MKRRKFVKNAAAASVLGLSASGVVAGNSSTKASNVYHELRIYYTNHGRNTRALHNYLQNALIPALNRLGINHVGVFTEMSQTTPPKIYVLITYPSFEAFGTHQEKLASDMEYVAASKDYIAIGSEKAIYNRYESSLMQAFDSVPSLEVPKATQGNEPRIFELRTYQSHNEDAHRRKVMMFDKGETPLFRKVKLNPVFFGKTIIGDNMPNLTYMLVFRDMKERDANWKDFVDSAEWNEMKVKPEYADTVSNIIRIFLVPAEYSQI